MNGLFVLPFAEMDKESESIFVQILHQTAQVTRFSSNLALEQLNAT